MLLVVMSFAACSSDDAEGNGSAGAGAGAVGGTSAGGSSASGGAAGGLGGSGAGTAGTGGAGGTAGSAASGGAAGTGGGAMGVPYGHVVPADVGVTIGIGVVAPAPSQSYSGPLTITSPTVIENVVIDGCVRVEADDVTLRNVVVNCDGLYPIRATGHDNLVVEHSKIHCTSNSKLFMIDDHTNVTVSKNELTGCEDFFFVGGTVDGLSVEYNYMHALNLTSESHADGFQIGEASQTTGTITIRGNYIDPEADGGKTDVVFATNYAENEIFISDNFFAIWGLRTLRCGGDSRCEIRTNVYEQAFEEMEQPGQNGKLLFMMSSSPKAHVFECNRLEDGSFVPEFQDGVDRVSGATHITTGCPELP